MVTKRTKSQELSDLIPTILQGDYVIIKDQITHTTYALVYYKKHIFYSKFMTYKEMKAYLIGMQDMIRISTINK